MKKKGKKKKMKKGKKKKEIPGGLAEFPRSCLEA